MHAPRAKLEYLFSDAWTTRAREVLQGWGQARVVCEALGSSSPGSSGSPLWPLPQGSGFLLLDSDPGVW